MKFIAALVVLAIIALAGSRRVLQTRRVPLGARLIFMTGTEFVVVGMLLGDTYLGILDERTLAGLEPFVMVCLCWVGLLFGLQFERRTLGTLPRNFFSISMSQAMITFVVVFWAFMALLSMATGGSLSETVFPAVTLAAAAACTGQPALAMIRRQEVAKHKHVLSFLHYVASVDGLAGVMAFGLVSCLHAASSAGGGALFALGTVALCLCLGLLLAWVLHSLAYRRASQPELLLMIMGTAALCAGFALQLRTSALFISVVCGIVVSNVSLRRVRMMETLAGGEHLIYVVLLLLAGARWNLPSPLAVGLAVAYFFVRMGGKVAGGYLATRPLRTHFEIPRTVGLGLTAQAGMALAIVVDYHHTSTGPLADLALSVAIIGIILSELFGPALALRVLRVRHATGEAS